MKSHLCTQTRSLAPSLHPSHTDRQTDRFWKIICEEEQLIPKLVSSPLLFWVSQRQLIELGFLSLLHCFGFLPNHTQFALHPPVHTHTCSYSFDSVHENHREKDRQTDRQTDREGDGDSRSFGLWTEAFARAWLQTRTPTRSLSDIEFCILLCNHLHPYRSDNIVQHRIDIWRDNLHGLWMAHHWFLHHVCGSVHGRDLFCLPHFRWPLLLEFPIVRSQVGTFCIMDNRLVCILFLSEILSISATIFSHILSSSFLSS